MEVRTKMTGNYKLASLFTLLILCFNCIFSSGTSNGGAQAQFGRSGCRSSFCPVPQYPRFAAPRCTPVLPRYLPGGCSPGFTFGCTPVIRPGCPIFLGQDLITDTIDCIEVPGGGTASNAAQDKDRIESLIPSLRNDAEIPDATNSSETDMSSVLKDVFKSPDAKVGAGEECHRAASLCRSGKFEQAIKLICDESAHAPLNARCEYVLANAHLGSGNLEEALKHIQTANSLDKNYAPAHFTEGCILYEMGKLQDALKAYTNALALRRDYLRCLDARAAVYYRLSDFVNAIKDYDHAVSLSRNDSNALYMRSLCYFMLGQYQMVPICFDEYLALKPNDADALADRGTAYFELGRYPEALADFNAALRLEPKFLSCLYKRCLLYWQIGQWQSALADAQEGLRVGGWKSDSAGYFSLCAYLLASRDKQSSSAQSLLALSLNQLDSTKWPYPIFRYFAGQVSLNELLVAANTNQRLTQAKVYAALWMSWSEQKSRADAVIMLNEVRAKGDSALPEYNLAVKELFGSKSKSASDIERPIGRRYALVVGISKYRDESINLKYAAKDAQDFSNFLIEREGFQKENVKLLTDEQATRQNILSALGDSWLPRNTDSDDLVLIYFSSHGSPSAMDARGLNYLITHDTDKDALWATGVPVQDLTRLVKDKVHANRIVIVMDACHSGAAKVDNTKIDAAGLAKQSGQAVICSSLPEEVSWESKKYPNSVFTHHLINGFQSKGHATSLTDAFQYTKEQVEQEVQTDRHSHQTPVLKSDWPSADLLIAK